MKISDRAGLIISCGKVMVRKPNDVEVYYYRGDVYSNKGDRDRVIVDFSKMIQLKPNYANAYDSGTHPCIKGM